MFTTCIFCLGDLGRNEEVEHFATGSRLAFDGDKGRLWVVCRRCQRWNLTPLDERWEAIEECERRFRDTRLRLSTEHIGLARLPGGLELIRVGRPQRPEFAAWRYGDQFGRRRRNNIIKAGLGLGALGAVVAGGAAVGASVGGFSWMLWQFGEQVVKGSPDKVLAKIPVEGRSTVKVKRKHLPHVHLLEAGDGWSLGLPEKKRLVGIEGDEALRAAGKLLPHLNRFAGKKASVADAVGLLDGEADPARYFATAARRAREPKFGKLPEPVRLALEMAAHEDTERRALEGELALLERSWREAEEIAAIADNLLIPRSVEDFIRRLRRS